MTFSPMALDANASLGWRGVNWGIRGQDTGTRSHRKGTVKQDAQGCNRSMTGTAFGKMHIILLSTERSHQQKSRNLMGFAICF